MTDSQIPYQIPAQDILKWVNFARTKPIEFAKEIEDKLPNFTGDKQIKKNGKRVICLEGRSAYMEAI